MSKVGKYGNVLSEMLEEAIAIGNDDAKAFIGACIGVSISGILNADVSDDVKTKTLKTLADQFSSALDRNRTTQ